MEILVRKTNNYGNEVIYPECEKAKIFADLAGTTTLTNRTIAHIKSLGYVINEYRRNKMGIRLKDEITWEDNSIQFPRLLAEIYSTIQIQDPDWKALEETMDLRHQDIADIFQRAENEWHSIKAKLPKHLQIFSKY